MAGAVMQEQAFRTGLDLGSGDPAQLRRTIEELQARIEAQNRLIQDLTQQIEEGSPAQSLTSPKTLRDDEHFKLLERIAELSGNELQLLTEIKGTFDKLNAKQSRITDEQSRIKQKVEDIPGLVMEQVKRIDLDIRADNNRLNEHADILDEHLSKINYLTAQINNMHRAPREPRGKKTLDRIEKLDQILRSGPKTFQEIERLLGISPKEMHRIVSRLDMRKYKISPRPGNERQKVIRLKTWSRSLTSNVKSPAEVVGKEA